MTLSASQNAELFQGYLQQQYARLEHLQWRIWQLFALTLALTLPWEYGLGRLQWPQSVWLRVAAITLLALYLFSLRLYPPHWRGNLRFYGCALLIGVSQTLLLTAIDQGVESGAAQMFLPVLFCVLFAPQRRDFILAFLYALLLANIITSLRASYFLAYYHLNIAFVLLLPVAYAAYGFIDNGRRREFEWAQALVTQVRRDELTGLANRREFWTSAQREWERSRRYLHPLSCLALDVDAFRKINEQYGHASGDEMLKFLSQLCLKQIRESDILARVGGDDFILLLPETDGVRAGEVAERIRHAIEQTPAEGHLQAARLTVSIGVATLQLGTAPQEVVDAADTALAQAKREGGNRVCLH